MTPQDKQSDYSPERFKRLIRWWRRLFGRTEATTYQKFLAVHLYHAAPKSALKD